MHSCAKIGRTKNNSVCADFYYCHKLSACHRSTLPHNPGTPLQTARTPEPHEICTKPAILLSAWSSSAWLLLPSCSCIWGRLWKTCCGCYCVSFRFDSSLPWSPAWCPSQPPSLGSAISECFIAASSGSIPSV